MEESFEKEMIHNVMTRNTLISYNCRCLYGRIGDLDDHVFRNIT